MVTESGTCEPGIALDTALSGGARAGQDGARATNHVTPNAVIATAKRKGQRMKLRDGE